MHTSAPVRNVAFLIALLTHAAAAQTKVDLQRQTNANIRQDGTTGQISVTRGFNAPLEVVPYSATPAFDAGAANLFTMTLSGDVTGSTLTQPKSGQVLTFRICQDAAGGRVFTWPPNFIGAGTISGASSACSQQSFVFDGAAADAIGALLITGVPGGAITLPGTVSGATSVQPAAVASGNLSLPAATDTLVARNTSDILTNKTIAGAANTISPTSGQTIGGFTGACNNSTFLRGDGACAAAAGGSPTTGGFRYLNGQPYYGGLNYLVATGGTSLSGYRERFTVSGTELYTQVDYYIDIAGSSGEGFLFGIFNNQDNSAVCITDVGTGSAITTTGKGSLQFSSGSGVSSGVCTLAAGGYYFHQTSDSTTLKTAVHQGAAAIGGNTVVAYTTGALSTGSGASLAFISNPSSLTWNTSTGAIIPIVGLEY